jgi:hypothetical protein
MIALAFGCYFGYMVKSHEVAQPDQVKRALYIACARSRNFDPTEARVGSCNRLSIDSALAAAYGRPTVPPPQTSDAIALYEAPLVELHQTLTQ